MWCGTASEGWFTSGTLNPCFFDTIAALAIFCAAALSLWQGYNYLASLARLGSHRSHLWSIPGTKGSHLVQVTVSVALACLHALTFAFSLGTGRPPAYVPTTEAVLALIWTTFAVLIFTGLRRDACLRLGSFSYITGAVYTIAAYSEVQFYLHGPGGDSPMQRGARLIAGISAAAASLAFLLAEIQKPPAPQGADAALHEALLSADESAAAAADTDTEAGERKRERHRSWVALVGTAARYMWPTGFWLQVRAVICVALIVVLRLLNLAVPIAYKKVIDEFSKLTADMHPPGGESPPPPISFYSAFYPWVFMWLLLFFLQGGGGGGFAVGLLSNIRSYLWIPIGQNSYRRACLDIFNHVMAMDQNFHLHRRTGELLRIMDRGTASIQTVLGTVVFQIGPAIFDIAAAAAFLAVRLKAWIAIIVFSTLGTYIPMTIILTEWRGRFRRDLNRLDNARGARATDALLNYETVKIFGNEELEGQQYATAIDAYQAVDFKLSASMNALNIAQSGVIFTGLAAGMMVCTAGVADGSLTVGDAVLFVTLMQQLYAPLNFFGTYYRMIQSAMLDMEGVIDLLKTEATVFDLPGAPALVVTKCQVEFDNVSFQYADGAPVLHNVNFLAPGGGTTALVGATGSGKSSLLRLLLRFYDPINGQVRIDGQSVSDVAQASLRSAIGVVPQDTVLFNDTIMYNIRYGRPSASDEEVRAAAEGACLHETIRDRFPLGYDTRVGERGLRLSGGEKQRVAFARALLKNPPILVLDEATSALDSITERRIQSTLSTTRAGRTVVVVAHRLSTIMDAERIVVMDKGRVVEIGTHDELLEVAGGKYAEMWTRQAEGAEGSTRASHPALAQLLDDDEISEESQGSKDKGAVL